LIVIIVIVVLVIVIPIILSAVLYFMISDLINPPTPTTEPNINIRSGEPVGQAGVWELKIGSVSSVEGLANYQVAVKKGASIVIWATDLTTVKSSGATGSGLYLNFTDATNDGKLNSGDWFTLEHTDWTSDYQVILYWKWSGNAVSGDTGRIEQ